MSLFDLDRTSCIRCGMCMRDCAFRALKSDAEGYPTLPNPGVCMKCQHCFAICPKGAISFDGKRPEDSIATANLELPSAKAVENWLQTRRSCRHFRDADVDRAELDKILKVLGNVPTGCNARSLTFTCYSTRAAMAAFKERFIQALENHRDGVHLLPRSIAIPAIKLRRGGEDVFFRGAAGMLIVSSDETAPGVTTPQEDVTIACAHFELLAQAHGLATCWCGFLKLVQNAVPEILEATSGIRRTTPFYAMLFGYPAVRYPRGIQRDNYAKIVMSDK